MSVDLLEELKRHFGHCAFRDGQEQVIRRLLAGKSALAIFPTGGGKSLCFQLPALLMDGVTLVVSPLIALMKDQVESLLHKGIAAARLDSTLSALETSQVYERLASGRLKLLYIAPERFANAGFCAILKKTKIALLAIDEAHCISEWGHNFRPDYLRLTAMAKKYKLRPILALTATATPPVAEAICRAFRISQTNRIQNSFRRPNLSLHVTPSEAGKRLSELTLRLQDQRRLPAVVYVTQQQTSEQIATHLKKIGVNAQAYHAGLTDEFRSEVQDAFMSGRTNVIVATIAFGMGIDKADVRSVYHFNLPKTLENYQQEIGRAGRDGNPAHCEMLACQDDLTVLGNFIVGDTPTPTALRQVVDHLLRQGSTFEMDLYRLSQATDVRLAVLETILTYLEVDGILTPLDSYPSQYKITFIPDQKRVLAGYPPNQIAYMQKLFSAGKQGWKWLTLEIDDAIGATNRSRNVILNTLLSLETAGEVELKRHRRRTIFQLCPDTTKRNPELIANRMVEFFATRERNDLARLDQIMQFARDFRCLSNHLLRYFGERSKSPCGQCTSCLEKKRRPRTIPSAPSPTIEPSDLASVRTVIGEKHPPLRGPRQLAKFLCGISSPATRRERLISHEAFGLLSGVPFEEVLVQTQSMVLL